MFVTMKQQKQINGAISDKICFEDDSISIRRENYAEESSNMPLHSHDYLTISIMISGNLVEYNDDVLAKAGTGSIFIKPSGTQHGDIFGENTSLISMRIYDPKYYGLHFDTWDLIPQSMGFPYFFKLIKEQSKKDYFDEFKAYLIKHRNQQKQKRAAPEWIQQVREILFEHYHEPLQIAQLAKEVGKHPVHLARTFKKYYGTDIKALQTCLKARHALEEMSCTNKNLTQIAYEHGFADQSHFSREFKKLTDFSPRQAKSMFQV